LSLPPRSIPRAKTRALQSRANTTTALSSSLILSPFSLSSTLEASRNITCESELKRLVGSAGGRRARARRGRCSEHPSRSTPLSPSVLTRQPPDAPCSLLSLELPSLASLSLSLSLFLLGSTPLPHSPRSLRRARWSRRATPCSTQPRARPSSRSSGPTRSGRHCSGGRSTSALSVLPLSLSVALGPSWG
jgi:hypothetical protein